MKSIYEEAASKKTNAQNVNTLVVFDHVCTTIYEYVEFRNIIFKSHKILKEFGK